MGGEPERPTLGGNVEPRRKGRELSARVHAGIGTTRAANLLHGGVHRADRSQELSRDGSRSFLARPPRKVQPVVREREKNRAHGSISISSRAGYRARRRAPTRGRRPAS